MSGAEGWGLFVTGSYEEWLIGVTRGGVVDRNPEERGGYLRVDESPPELSLSGWGSSRVWVGWYGWWGYGGVLSSGDIPMLWVLKGWGVQ
eukprot:760853-Hanusia_phi.AAC.13